MLTEEPIKYSGHCTADTRTQSVIIGFSIQNEVEGQKVKSPPGKPIHRRILLKCILTK
jgi:hypothetical protein